MVRVASMCLIFYLQSLHYFKSPKNSDAQTIAVIILKFEQCSFTIHLRLQKAYSVPGSTLFAQTRRTDKVGI